VSISHLHSRIHLSASHDSEKSETQPLGLCSTFPAPYLLDSPPFCVLCLAIYRLCQRVSDCDSETGGTTHGVGIRGWQDSPRANGTSSAAIGSSHHPPTEAGADSCRHCPILATLHGHHVAAIAQKVTQGDVLERSSCSTPLGRPFLASQFIDSILPSPRQAITSRLSSQYTCVLLNESPALSIQYATPLTSEGRHSCSRWYRCTVADSDVSEVSRYSIVMVIEGIVIHVSKRRNSDARIQTEIPRCNSCSSSNRRSNLDFK